MNLLRAAAVVFAGLVSAPALAQDAHHLPFGWGDQARGALPETIVGRYPQPDLFGSPLYLPAEAGRGMPSATFGPVKNYAPGEAAVYSSYSTEIRDAKGDARHDRRRSAWKGKQRMVYR